MMLKNRIGKDPSLYEPNQEEIARVIRDVNDDQSITEKQRLNLLGSLESLKPKEEANEEA
jgi:hypothetical protein